MSRHCLSETPPPARYERSLRRTLSSGDLIGVAQHVAIELEVGTERVGKTVDTTDRQ